MKESRRAKANLKNNAIISPDIKTYTANTVMKTIWYWLRDKQLMKQKREPRNLACIHGERGAVWGKDRLTPSESCHSLLVLVQGQGKISKASKRWENSWKLGYGLPKHWAFSPVWRFRKLLKRQAHVEFLEQSKHPSRWLIGDSTHVFLYFFQFKAP